MSSRSSGVASGLGSQPSTSLLAQRKSFPALHLCPPQSSSLTLPSQEDFLQSFNRRLHNMSDVLRADLLDCNYSIPDPQLIRRIVSQVEFYLSDENLSKDAFLLKHVQKNKMGFVSIKLLTSFKKVKYLTRDWRLTLYALQFSELLEVNKEGTKVRRRVPVPESLLSIPPSKLLLAWELLPQGQGVLPPLQKNFLETITRMFSPFGAIASIRILRPGRKLPSDVRKYTSRFPELLSKCCALVEYESLESARRAFESLGRQSCPGGESIRVVRLCGKSSKKKAGAEREAAPELVDQLGWKAQAAATSPYGIGESLLCSSPEPDSALELSSFPWNKEPSIATWSSTDFKPSDFSNAFNGSLLTSKVFGPLGTGVGTGGWYGLCSSPKSPCSSSWGRGGGLWGPCCSNPIPDAKPPPSNPLAAKRVPEHHGLQDGVLRLPHGPDGTKGFSSSSRRGELVPRH
ncbi:PREDICTED: la-related protein 6-like [Calidris pugnax]|uniref:la-related protein 6-like n=1 Tax=Calidris pugnax TaxID=198806 RepID=UPI00071D0110|nr:PREDICTED: la-related protein 6-like [Calidris pugnax]XP_014817116.1 PREDICTED: la-related protein 6-like [Calidris pugnax]